MKKFITFLLSILFIITILSFSPKKALAAWSSQYFDTNCGVDAGTNPCSVGYFNPDCSIASFTCVISPFCNQRPGSVCHFDPIWEGGFQQCVNTSIWHNPDGSVITDFGACSFGQPRGFQFCTPDSTTNCLSPLPPPPTPTPTPPPSCSSYTSCLSCTGGAPFDCGWTTSPATSGSFCQTGTPFCPVGNASWYWTQNDCNTLNNRCFVPPTPTPTPIPQCVTASDCFQGNQCVTPQCVNNQCVFPGKPDGTACNNKTKLNFP